MKSPIAALVCALSVLRSVSAQHFELALDSRAAAEALTITNRDPLASPYQATTIDRAMRAIERQIEEKRAADAARTPLQPFWEANFWNSPLMKLIPVGGGTQRYAEDPYVMADYLTIARRQSDYQLKLSDERALSLFGK
jgi:hypothetical protein